MNSTQAQAGYRFDDHDLSHIRGFVERTHHTTGITVSYGTGESRGFAAATLGIDDASLGFKGDVAIVQSWCPVAGVIEFGVLSVAGKQPIGEKYTFDALFEALIAADVFLRRFIEDLTEKRAKEMLDNSQALSASTATLTLGVSPSITRKTMSQSIECTFTPDQKALLNQSMELVWEREREPVFIESGMSGRFESARIGIEGHQEQPLFMLQSLPHNDGIAYAIVKLGPPPDLANEEVTTHATFVDAVQKLQENMEAFVRQAKAPFQNLRLPALGESDRQILQELASVVGREAGHPAFADFRDVSEAAQVCGVGVVVNGQRIIVASLVGVYGVSGFECSVKNFQNEQVPGTPNLFSSVAQAIAAHHHYFAVIAKSLREQKKPWWKRIL